MSRHKHADLIHAWAEGAEIQYKNGSGYWVNAGSSPSFHSEVEYRVKPKEPEWYENIPKNGVLCWVGDNEALDLKSVAIIIAYRKAPFKYQGHYDSWMFATPLTNEEIEGFKQ